MTTKTTDPLAIRLDYDTLFAVTQLANEEGIPLATLIRSLVKTHPKIKERVLARVELLRKRKEP